MYSTRGIEAVATITELRSKTSELVEHAKRIERGILIQKNNEPYAVLISYDLYDKLLSESETPQAGSPGREEKKSPATLPDEALQFLDAPNDRFSIHGSILLGKKSLARALENGGECLKLNLFGICRWDEIVHHIFQD